MYTKTYIQTLTMKFVFSNSQTAVSESWFQFNVGEMHTLSTDNLFNLSSLELMSKIN